MSLPSDNFLERLCLLSPADSVYQYLSARETATLRPADLIVGFGHFDLRIARRCAELWQFNLAPRILFTGGVGAGSADLAKPEADAFADVLFKLVPDFPREHLITETQSTNTGDNIRFSLELLKNAKWDVNAAILVATPFRQRRVMQTWSQVTDGIPAQNAPLVSDLAIDRAVFAEKKENLVARFPGEIERLTTYAKRGWISPTKTPTDLHQAIVKL